MITISRTVALTVAPWLLGGSMALGLGVAPAAHAIEEDDPGWSCVDDGNRTCGPDNSNGVPAGCYDEGGVLVAPWPCHVVVNPDGSSDVYEGREGN